jgi:large subunit ribosomal protein L15
VVKCLFNRVEYVGINLDVLQGLVEKFNIAAISLEVLRDHGLISKSDLVKILGRGELKSKVEVAAHAFSATAQAAIEKAGGSISKIS